MFLYLLRPVFRVVCNGLAFLRASFVTIYLCNGLASSLAISLASSCVCGEDLPQNPIGG